jgi:hypothetical protein
MQEQGLNQKNPKAGLHWYLLHRNPTSRSRIVGFFQKRKVGKAFSFCSTPKLVSSIVMGMYRVTRLVYEKFGQTFFRQNKTKLKYGK